MDYILYSMGTTGDILPFLRLAQGLNKLGHHAILLSNEKFLSLANSFDVEFYAVSSVADYERAYSNPLTWSPLHSKHHYRQLHAPAIKPTFNKIKALAAASGNDPVVLYQDPLSGARMAAIELELKHCQVVLAPQVIYSALNPSFPLCKQIAEIDWPDILPKVRAKSLNEAFEKTIKPIINPLREEIGIPPWSISDMSMLEFTHSMLALFPEWLKNIPHDWPKQLATTGFLLSDTFDNQDQDIFDTFVHKFGPPITFSFGTGIPITAHVVEKIRRVCRELKQPGILVCGTQPKQIADDCVAPLLIAPAAKFSNLFQKSTIVVHHGGIGTCAQALAAGIPQLISPYAFDQPDNAYLLWQLGVSNSIDFQASTVFDIIDGITELTTSAEVAKKCSNFRSLTGDSISGALDFVVSL